ncbi:unnamed protein product [Pelagomonas calceolata]|uniref:Uncharacterized protein n=1 Tax=Pelagomonas calceolata TaxID=35677 RepID=A0A8J2X0J8_9STRA|nr:unnamed protein product [Pelagomonas calceolata]
MMNIQALIASWLLHQTTAFLRPPLPSAAVRRALLGEGVIGEGVLDAAAAPQRIGEGIIDAAPIVEAPRLIGEGVVLDAVPDASPINAGSLLLLAAVAVAGVAAFVSQNFEPNPDMQRVEPSPSAYDAPQPEIIFADRTAPQPEALFADRTYYVVRWRSRRDTVYEGLNSVAESAKAGTDVSVRCISLMEANALTRRLVKADPGVAAQTFKITGSTVTALAPGGGSSTGSAEDEAWVGDFTDIVTGATPAPVGGTVPVPGSAPVSTDDDRQAIWDDLAQDEAEREAAEARTDVDEQWSKYLESLRVTKGEIDSVVIGGVDGPAPCRLCNGKGYRVLFGGRGAKEAPCEWCGGRGYEEEDS